MWRQMHRVHTSAGQRLVRVLHYPCTVVPIQNQVCGKRNPLSCILVGRFLAVPELRFRHPDRGTTDISARRSSATRLPRGCGNLGVGASPPYWLEVSNHASAFINSVRTSSAVGMWPM